MPCTWPDVFGTVRAAGDRDGINISAAAGYIVIIISASFCGRGAMWSYAFSFLPELRGRYILPLVEAYSVSGGTLCWLRRHSQKGEVSANC